ncbi:MAG: metal ABC transporter ATP-binding protein [Clostridiales bacterium]|nr:metal ABC transporter ATP-binding protein [Clostridiales bacterium]MDY3832846.1 metal ABC transporter ATP-binding protein [Candidatus Ventricola sp.]
MEKIKPLRKSQFAPEDAPEKEQPACPHPHLSGPEAGCRLCRIEVDKLTVSFGAQTPLKDVSLHIHCGELTALIGTNGAGKTTLLRAMLGQIEYTGTIRHLTSDGRPAADLRTGYVPQQLEFDRSSPVTVMDFMAGSLSRRPVFLGVSKKARERVLAALERTHCAQLADRTLGALSGGELQRVLLALALTPQPDLLILDEPVSGVDQNGMETFYQTVDELKHRNHMAILLVSHDLSVVERYADRVVLMQGTVIKQGSPEVVFDSPEFEQVFYAKGGRA